MTDEPTSFEGDVRETDHTSVVVLRGELDLASAAALEALVARCAGDRLVVDLMGVTFIDSSGLAVLLQATADRAVTLQHPSESVARILETTGVLDRFEVQR